MSENNEEINYFLNKKYKHGFSTSIETDSFEPSLNEDVIRRISSIKKEPDFLLSWRLDAFNYWKTLSHPDWGNINFPKINYQNISYYSAPKKKSFSNLKEVDPELLRVYKKLGITLSEQKMFSGVAIDAIFDSVSVITTFKDQLSRIGIIFCSFSEAVKNYPDLIKKYLGSVVHYKDNFYAALNSAVFSDGSFVYIPNGVRCPMELSTYFRINSFNIGQFERTLIIADKNSYVSYLEGCTAPIRDHNQLHAAVVELVALDGARIKYSTIQNWYPGNKNGQGGIYNFVTKRGMCFGNNSKISWTQIETGSLITWKYPSVILKGDNSIGEFYSIALSNNYQQFDTGTKMIHLGKSTRSTIISKSICAGYSKNSYRGLVSIDKDSINSRNYTQCDSLLIGNHCSAYTFPYIKVRNSSSITEHEAMTTKINEEQLFYCQQRGLSLEDSISVIVNGYCKKVLKELPMEFAVEATKLLGINLEGAIG
ncbi:Fe-S cluster assembly protein SufB [Candidatus Legionella polyplacis]|uniref:Fe-S cluster assembly protein SufB n=1 Tax=Candidatus Legionella polyplacis TaxID=2005262 RepID=A0ABZ2GZL0_9GAMM|nr:Fe-S cluster assembly protein SufB [Candidatus Legionella polyplacis]ATW01848.1 Fe-S cluster assembly protein SufB [Candidatus Legionella polyplacis]